jgi:hypothetical protein
MLSTVGEVGLEVILNIALGAFKEMIVMRFMVKTAAMTTMIAWPRTVGLGCFSPMQRLDERSDGSLTTLSHIFRNHVCQHSAVDSINTSLSLFRLSREILKLHKKQAARDPLIVSREL